ncbi:MAG: IclR family transcriptional regulator [Pseudomonadota bacterium]
MSTPLNASVLKGFEILGLFSEGAPEISTATVVEGLGMNTATAHRFLMSLEECGALISTRRGHFMLGPRVEELGRLAEVSNGWSALVQPKLEALSKDLGESVMACRLSSNGPVCVAVAHSQQTISVNIRLGTLLPLHLSAQGKLWLADMPEASRSRKLKSLPVLGPIAPDIEALNAELATIRKQGFALNLGDNEPDIAAVSIPLRDRTERMCLSLSVFGLLSRFDDAFIERCKKTLHLAAAEVHELL